MHVHYSVYNVQHNCNKLREINIAFVKLTAIVNATELGFPIGISLRGIARLCGIARRLQSLLLQVKSTCVGNPSKNLIQSQFLIPLS